MGKGKKIVKLVGLVCICACLSYVFYSGQWKKPVITGVLAAYNLITPTHQNENPEICTVKDVVARKQRLLRIHDITFPQSHRYFPRMDDCFICPNGVAIQWTFGLNPNGMEDIIAVHQEHTPANLSVSHNKHALFVVYGIESEYMSKWNRVNSDRFHFGMNYNFKYSMPAPFTYFRNIKRYIMALITPPAVDFEKKLGIVWLASNCFAPNRRTNIVKKIMNLYGVDSYGGCLRNIVNPAYRKFGDPKVRDRSSVDLYSKYKFAIVIENSNCEDYVTEKLFLAIEAGTIPIVISDGKFPDYDKFAPPHSYINVGDFVTTKDFVEHIKMLSSNKTAYDSYFWYKETIENIPKYAKMKRDELRSWARDVKFYGCRLSKELLTKENGDNRYCKLAEFLLSNGYLDKGLHTYKQLLPARRGLDLQCLPVEYFANHTAPL